MPALLSSRGFFAAIASAALFVGLQANAAADARDMGVWYSSQPIAFHNF